MLDSHMQKKKKKKKKIQSQSLTPFKRLKSKKITDTKGKCKTLKILEDHIAENRGDLGFGDGFLDTTPRAWVMKETIDKLNFFKMKNVHGVKDTVKTMQ